MFYTTNVCQFFVSSAANLQDDGLPNVWYISLQKWLMSYPLLKIANVYGLVSFFVVILSAALDKQWSSNLCVGQLMYVCIYHVIFIDINTGKL